VSNAFEIDAADAIVSELNDPARSWAGRFTAERLWLPIYDVDAGDLDTLQIPVIPPAISSQERESRVKEKFIYEFYIGFQKRVPFSAGVPDKAACDALSKLAQDIHDWFRAAHRLATLPAGLVVSAERPAIYDLATLHVQHVFETLIEVSVRADR
jgi:hypothetical protein